MHEMGIAQQLIQIALDSIPKYIESPRVEKVNLRIGKLASVVEHSLTFCFEIIAKDTPLENARLIIEVVPVRVHCKSCDHQWEVTGPVFKCPFCEDGEVEMMTGREIEITSLELAD
ncbi:MAG: hydrogenase maturation nickel metallochaperone HypA [Proteobacteria bacterium]|nr:hydrogenase maturation nickel metallochaperone HypA [Pseudomonadota bacterium]MBU2454054.1 hydrogenase maturation nickel metallochaperone HypA [Pseudomonadota bacterium]MBU2628653.1 hydrogenase maturation nickel metallochaperone HypA [Pseudomonadota bacterium]